jgi:hypothetical protein
MFEGFSHLTPDWYRESRELFFGLWLVQRVSHCYYIIFSFIDSYLLTVIWQLRSYFNPFILYCEVDYQIQIIIVCVF